MVYVLDANVFIQAKNLHYGFDFCPGFWDWLQEQAGQGGLMSLDKVRDELLAVEDELTDWAKDLDGGFFQSLTGDHVAALAAVSQWANGEDYEDGAVNIFLQVADYYLVAYALAIGATVVTHEKHSDSRKKIKIPNACLGVGVSCVTPFEMLRREHARFVLGVGR